MRESISTSERAAVFARRAAWVVALGTLLITPSWTSSAWAQDASAGPGASPSPPPKKEDKTLQPEEDDFSSTPFTQYGEFNDQAAEDEEMKFFQYGRFFGVSLGLGFEGVTGNRGLLWQGGFPGLDLRIHVWLDFNLALALGIFSAPHFYVFNAGSTPTGRTDVQGLRAGLDVKYYFDTKDMSAPISFSNPFVLLSAGTFTKTEVNVQEGTNESDTAFALSFGGGFEFPISVKRVYLVLDGRYTIANFKDTASQDFKPVVNDLSGNFYSATTSIMFTW